MKHWLIFIRDREMAQVHGDPCLGEVVAGSKEEAETIAARKSYRSQYVGAGVWAVEKDWFHTRKGTDEESVVQSTGSRIGSGSS